MNQPAASRQTRESLRALLAQQRGRAPGSQLAAVGLATSLTVLGASVLSLAWSKGHSFAANFRPDQRKTTEFVQGATLRDIQLFETLAVLGAWAVAIPLIGPVFGYAPETTTRLEIADHVLPGLITLAFAGVCVARLVKSGAQSKSSATSLAATFLAGLWMTSAHAPLILEALRDRFPWGLVLFHASAGPPILVASVVLFVRTSLGPMRLALQSRPMTVR